MWLLSLDGLKLPGSAAARSRPTEGFSAMTRVLLMALRPSVPTLSPSMGAGTRAHHPACITQRARHHRVPHPEAGAPPAARAVREDRGQPGAAAVHGRTPGVARAHEPAQRRDLARDPTPAV